MRLSHTAPRTFIFVLALSALPLGLVSLPAQEASNNDLKTLKEQLERLDRKLNAGQERESKLLDRVTTLEVQLKNQKRSSEDRIAELQDTQEPSDPIAQRIAALESSLAPRLVQSAASQIRGIGSAPVTLGGYFDIEFRDDDTKDQSAFDQHRLILQLSANILPNIISFRSEIEIEGGGADASFLSGNEIVVEFAELHFRILDEFNVKVGALLVPFGRFNYLHDSPLRDLTDRPLVNRRIIPTTWTDAGIGFYGVFDLGDFLAVDYDVIVSQGLDGDFSSTPGGGFRSNRNSLRADNNDNKMVIGRVGFQPEFDFLDYTNVGISFGFGKYDDDGRESITLFGIDWTFKKGPFELIGEYARFSLSRSETEIAAGAPESASGFYAQINYHFFPDAWRGQTPFFTKQSTFTLVFRFGTIDTDSSAVAIDRISRGDAYRDDLIRYTAGINFRPIEKTVIKLEYQFFDERGGVESAGNNRLVISFATYF